MTGRGISAILNKRGLPITPGSLYLIHFARPAGAVALLSAAEDADAASLMAAADATGRTTREKLISANPFLKALTVAEIKSWADRKMAWAIRQSACESLKKPRDGEKEDSSIGA